MLAIDGKTLRRSFDTAGQSPLHVVTAFGCERRLVLAQAAVRTKENEVLAARDVLNMLDIKCDSPVIARSRLDRIAGGVPRACAGRMAGRNRDDE